VNCDTETLIDLTPAERGIIIIEHADISEQEDGLANTKKISDCINSFVGQYFEELVLRDTQRASGSVLANANFRAALQEKFLEFKPGAIASLRAVVPSKKELISRPKNPYELAGAVKLAFANRSTRSLSTTMGLLWERIASISPYAINPELEFNLKVKGIDLIVKNFESGLIEYHQLKTQKNTLTGSQSGRSVSELEIHANPVFSACFNLSSWTFGDVGIPRVAGEDFWGKIGIEYPVFIEEACKMILELEDEYVELLNQM
jgi:hypothetical protein